MKKKISVVIPVYNAEKRIGDMIKDVCAQSYQNYELLIIDDGSTDDTALMVRKYAQNNSRIKLISISNSGVSVARNTGLQAADGEYIIFLDADDRISSRMLEHMYLCLEDNKDNMVSCKYTLNQKELIESDLDKKKISRISRDAVLKEMCLPQNNVAAFVWNRMFRLSFLRENNLFFCSNIKACEDTLFNYNCLKYIKTICIIDEALYYYNINEDSTMYHKDFNPNKLTGNDAFEIMMSDEKSEDAIEHIEVACMLYNVILAKQIKRYKCCISQSQLDTIRNNLSINVKAFNTSNVNIKYKLARYFLLLIL